MFEAPRRITLGTNLSNYGTCLGNTRKTVSPCLWEYEHYYLLLPHHLKLLKHWSYRARRAQNMWPLNSDYSILPLVAGKRYSPQSVCSSVGIRGTLGSSVGDRTRWCWVGAAVLVSVRSSSLRTLKTCLYAPFLENVLTSLNAPLCSQSHSSVIVGSTGCYKDHPKVGTPSD